MAQSPKASQDGASLSSKVRLPSMNSAVIPTSEAGVWYEYRPLPTGRLWLPFNSGVGVHSHFTRRTLIFRVKSTAEEKWTARQGHKGRTCPL